MKALALSLLLLVSPNLYAKPFSANTMCLGATFLPDPLFKIAYDKGVEKKLMKRINREIKRKVITEDMSEFIISVVRSDEFKQIIVDQSEDWCRRRDELKRTRRTR